MKKISLLTVIICGLLLVTGCGSDQYTIERDYWRIQKQVAKIFKNPHASPPNELEGVVELLRDFADKHGRTNLGIESEFNIARLYIVKEEYEKARAHLNALMDKYKESKAMSSEVMFMLGNTYEIAGDWNRALELYKRIAKEYPATLRGLNLPIYIALHYKAKFQPDMMVAAFNEAASHYKALAEKNNDTPLGFKAETLVAQSYIGLKDWQSAINTLDGIIKKYKDRVNTEGLMLDMALIYNRELKEKDKARQILQKIIDEYPDSKLIKTATALLNELDKKEVKEPDKK